MTSCVEAVFLTTNEQELAEQYDKWAASYESDLGGHAGPAEAVEQCCIYVPRSARILDAGCGTGLVGGLLAEQGYSNLEGLDLSPGMLQEARKKNCYNALYQQALGEPLDFPDACFDAIVIIGVFVMAHARSHSFDELIRITKPGGHIIFTLRPEFYVNTDFKAKMDALAAAGRWSQIKVTEPFHGRFKAHPEVNLQVWVYAVNA